MSDIFYFNIKDLATASKKDEIDAGFIIVVMRNHLEAMSLVFLLSDFLTFSNRGFVIQTMLEK